MTLKTQDDYLKEINHQMTKTIPDQVEDLKKAIAQLCVALDKWASSYDKIEDENEEAK